MRDNDSLMALELREAPAVVSRQASGLSHSIGRLVSSLRQAAPKVIVTCARGSSAHAATFAKHLFENRLGIPVAAAAPSIASVYHRRLILDGQLFLAISQSGQSDDLVAMAEMANGSGALTIAIVNDLHSPIASACKFVLPIAAGAERSVSATKSFIGTLTVLLRWVASWTDDWVLNSAIDRLPERLEAAIHLNWNGAFQALADASRAITIGRGPTLAIAREAALKLKETCNVHAEAFSSAEFQHGPMALVGRDLPLLVFTPGDAAETTVANLAADLARKEAMVMRTEDGSSSMTGRLPTLRPDIAETDAVCLIQTFYSLVIRIATTRGCNADAPPHLQKVTRTR